MDPLSIKTIKFTENWQTMVNSDDFVLIVPNGIETERELFELYYVSGKFPDYFGWNWDAFAECVVDWEWINAKKIFLIHNGIPFKTDMARRDIYLSIIAIRSLELLSSDFVNLVIVFLPSDYRDFDISFRRWEDELVGLL